MQPALSQPLPDDFRSDVDAVQRIDAVPRILDVVCRATGMGFAAVARVTEERWVACAVNDKIQFGLQPGGELEVETTICNEIRQSLTPVVINEVSADPHYCGHPTPARYGFQSYISMPIMLASGTFFGTLCAIDPRPARINTPQNVEMFRLFAELIAFHLDSAERLASSEANLLSERHTAELRDQFIAVLGHDLRNPLASIGAGINLLSKQELPPDASKFVGLMRNSVNRMSTLIDNVLDLARGRLGGGITIERDSQLVEPILQQVVSEMTTSHAGRTIETHFNLADPVECDGNRIARLASNLLGNALTHGAPEKPVVMRASTAGGQFEMSVANQGTPIASEILARMFEPFSRGIASKNAQGLGLGLYIAREIARAHDGTLDVTSNADETIFIFRMALQRARAPRGTTPASHAPVV
jgi:signal transduction histidine kinase